MRVSSSLMAEKPQPVRVLYCGVCGLPAEYCEFGPDFESCKPWLIQNVPDLYPDLLKGYPKTETLSPSVLYTQGTSDFVNLNFLFCLLLIDCQRLMRKTLIKYLISSNPPQSLAVIYAYLNTQKYAHTYVKYI